MHQTIKQIETGKIVAILRGDFSGREEELVAAMIAGGLTAVEVTLNSRDVMAAKTAPVYFRHAALGRACRRASVSRLASLSIGSSRTSRFAAPAS